jgi:hypothetical protein
MNEKIKEQVRVIIKEEVRKGNLGEMAEILKITEDLFDAVFVDAAKVQNKISSTIKKSGANNPLNAVFKIFGLRLVKEDSLESGVERDSDATKAFMKYLIINEKRMQESVGEIADAMRVSEKKRAEREKELVDISNKSVKENEELRKRIANTESEMNSTFRDVAIGMQDIISLSKDDKIVDESQSILEDMGFTVVWETTEERFFNIQKGISAQKKSTFNGKVQGNVYISKPAILKDGEIVIKGYMYVDEE